MTTDFTITDHGSIVILRPHSPAAHSWVEDHIPEDAQVWAGGIVVEPRYVLDIVDGIHADGLIFGTLEA